MHDDRTPRPNGGPILTGGHSGPPALHTAHSSSRRQEGSSAAA